MLWNITNSIAVLPAWASSVQMLLCPFTHLAEDFIHSVSVGCPKRKSAVHCKYFQDEAIRAKSTFAARKPKWGQLSEWSFWNYSVFNRLFDVISTVLWGGINAQQAFVTFCTECVDSILILWKFLSGYLHRVFSCSGLRCENGFKKKDTPCFWKSWLLTISVMDATFCFWSFSGGMQE